MESRCIVVLFVGVQAACASSSPPPVVVLPQDRELAPLRPQEPYISARSEFTVVLDTPLGSRASSAGQRWTAHVEHPVRSPENEIVIPTGALLHGEVVSVERGPAPLVRIRFTDIGTVFGPVPLTAVLRDAEHYAWLPRAVSYEHWQGYDATLYSPTRHPQDDFAFVDTAVGGGPRDPSEQEEILIPAGAHLRVALSEAIVPPRNAVRPR